MNKANVITNYFKSITQSEASIMLTENIFINKSLELLNIDTSLIEYTSYGSTSKVFIFKDKVIVLTFDILKCLYLKRLAKKGFINFTFLRIIDLDDKFILTYEMELLKTLEDYNYNDYTGFRGWCSEVGDYSDSISEGQYEALDEFNVEIFENEIYESCINKKYLPAFYFDIHEDQILVKDNKYLCLDPIIPINLS